MAKVAHGLSGSVFCNQSQRIHRAQPSCCNLEMPRPPSSGGLVTMGQAVSNALLSLPPSPKESSSDFVNSLECPGWEVHGHHQINQHRSKHELHKDFFSSPCKQVSLYCNDNVTEISTHDSKTNRDRLYSHCTATKEDLHGSRQRG